jgi:hypothetical protein
MSRRLDFDGWLLLKPPLLLTESVDEFDRFHQALEHDVKPRCVIERIYVTEFCSTHWEIMRLRRSKVAIINRAFRAALRDVVFDISPKREDHSEGRQKLEESSERSEEREKYFDRREEASAFALAWFSNQEAKEIIALRLAEFQLDISAVEVAAMKYCSDDLERLDMMQISLESRRDRTLRSIGEYRDSLARQLRESSQRISEGRGALRLGHAW